MQGAVDAEHALIIAHDVVLDAMDNRSLEPMAAGAKDVLGRETFHVVADAGYSHGEQAAKCEGSGILPCVPAMRTRNPLGDSPFLQCDAFRYTPPSDEVELCRRIDICRESAVRLSAEERLTQIAKRRSRI